MYWYRHLKLCGLLVDYNRTFIVLNLSFLFFIVLFPFSVSSMMLMSGTFFLVATLIYFANIFFTTLTHFILYTYLLGKGKAICKQVSEIERKILLEESFIPIFLITFICAALILSFTLLKDSEYSGLIYLPIVAFLVFIRRRLRARHRRMKAEIVSNQDSNG
jgi:uncharacterized membrane protein